MHSIWEFPQEVQVQFSENLATREEVQAVYEQVTEG